MKLTRVAALAAGLLLVGSVPAAFGAIPSVSQATIPSAVPSAATPNVFGGQVLAIAQVGSTMVIGGDFTSVGGPGTNSGAARTGLAAFDATTGAVTDFAPTLDGEVDTIVPDPARNAVYVGGEFKHANGTTTRIASINVTTGQLTTGFIAPAFNGFISDMQLGGTPQRLFVGGKFTTVAGLARNGLATLDPATGAFDPYLNIPLTDHHNYGHVNGAVMGQVGAENVALNPAGDRLIVDGNFRKAGTYTRDQIVSITLGATATVQTNWNTNAYTNPCKYQAFDSYVRDISWSPDGTYFVVATTGGYPGGQVACDAASRFNAATTGTAVTPAWKALTGKDSLWSVAATGNAVYVGGHQRWMNNPNGFDNAGPGAVPRPGLAALDPTTGLPLAWNPGRQPRGEGAQVIYPTPDGIWVGSDTDYIGNSQYRRAKLAFFPLDGGYAPPAENTGNSAKIFEGGRTTPSAFASRTFNSSTGAGGTITPAAASNQPVWAQVHGAFFLNGRVWYGYSDGFFYYRTFDGSTFGPPIKVDPYKDPAWDGQSTGSVTTSGAKINYDGAYPGFYGTEIKNVTAMFYSNKAIYYTVAGKAGLYKRAFSPDTAQISSTQAVGGVISPLEQVVRSSGWSGIGGMFVAGGKLWFSKTDGKLYKIAFVNGAPSGSASVDTAGKVAWNAKAVFTSP